MHSLLTRVQSRLHRHTSEDYGDAAAPATLHCPKWLAAAIGVAMILIVAVTVAISLTSVDDGELASAGTNEPTTEPTSETTGTTVTDRSAVATEPEPETAAPAPAPAAPPAPSAVTDLAGFFAAADRVDQRLEAAAERFNTTIGPDTVEVDEATWEAVRSIDPGEAAAAIPPGLPPDLLLEVLIVQDNLTSRAAALDGAAHNVDSGDMEAALGCLENGGVKAERFDSDVAAAKAVARSSAAVEVAAPDSRAAGELALQLSIINGLNRGCGSCGGKTSPVELAAITWYDEPTADPETGSVYEGTVDSIGFSATYTGERWKVSLNAC
jgi:hypothetical protein